MSSITKKNSEAYLRMYRQMARIRTFEDNANQLYLSAKMPGLTHMYSGQEAVAVGICEVLERTDKITSTHRGHGHCIAKGAEFKEMFCELLGKAEGYCRGKGGSMHIADQENGNLGANAIVGGSAWAPQPPQRWAKRLGRKDVAVCFFGDGAPAAGPFLRSDEHGCAMEAAGHLRLRKHPQVASTPRSTRWPRVN